MNKDEKSVLSIIDSTYGGNYGLRGLTVLNPPPPRFTIDPPPGVMVNILYFLVYKTAYRVANFMDETMKEIATLPHIFFFLYRVNQRCRYLI